MGYTLQTLADEIRAALEGESGAAGRRRAAAILTGALKDPAFVAEHLKDRAKGADPREVLYEDPKLGFCICGHVYEANANGKPHDHGSSWAIYGQATGVTEMTDWSIVETGDGERPALVVPARVYDLKPGEAHFYDVGDVHSPRRAQPVKLIRVEGANLDHVKRSNIKAKV